MFGRISGGHRHATHSFLGIAVFTALAWVSCHFRADWGGRAGLALLMTLSVSAALEALHLARGQVADLAGVAVAAAAIWYGYGLRFIPIAVLLGCATHITGDMLTDSGCMLGYPWSRQRFHLLPEPLAFTTGTLPGVADHRPHPVRGAAGPRGVDRRPGLRHRAMARAGPLAEDPGGWHDARRESTARPRAAAREPPGREAGTERYPLLLAVGVGGTRRVLC